MNMHYLGRVSPVVINYLRHLSNMPTTTVSGSGLGGTSGGVGEPDPFFLDNLAGGGAAYIAGLFNCDGEGEG